MSGCDKAHFLLHLEAIIFLPKCFKSFIRRNISKLQVILLSACVRPVGACVWVFGGRSVHVRSPREGPEGLRGSPCDWQRGASVTAWAGVRLGDSQRAAPLPAQGGGADASRTANRGHALLPGLVVGSPPAPEPGPGPRPCSHPPRRPPHALPCLPRDASSWFLADWSHRPPLKAEPASPALSGLNDILPLCTGTSPGGSTTRRGRAWGLSLNCDPPAPAL